jgi:hypothetical protein
MEHQLSVDLNAVGWVSCRDTGGIGDFTACKGCGYHVCSCKRPEYVAPLPDLHSGHKGYGFTDEGIEIRHFAYIRPGASVAWFVKCSTPEPHIICGLLTQTQLGVMRTVKKPAVQERKTTERPMFTWPMLTPEQRREKATAADRGMGRMMLHHNSLALLLTLCGTGAGCGETLPADGMAKFAHMLESTKAALVLVCDPPPAAADHAAACDVAAAHVNGAVGLYTTLNESLKE